MKSSLSITLVLLFLALSASAQRSNDAIQKQIRSLKADKQITLTFDGGSTKIMAIADNFADAEAKSAGVRAMNFGIAYFYPGKELAAPPETINFTFWVMSKKPKFAAANAWKATIGAENLDLGDARYAAKSGENMEYLNFKLKRDDLAKIANSTGKITIGQANFTFTASQLTLLKNIIAVSDNK